MLNYDEYCKLVGNEKMIEHIRSFREMDLKENLPTPEEVMKHVEFVAKDKETFVSFILLCDRLDRRDKAFTNLTTYHTLLTSKDKQEYSNQSSYVNLFNASLKEDGDVQDVLTKAMEYESDDKLKGKLLKI